MEANENYSVEDFVSALIKYDKVKVWEIFLVFLRRRDPEWTNGYKPVYLAYKYERYYTIEQIMALDFVRVNLLTSKKENTPLHWAILSHSKHGRSVNECFLKPIRNLLSKNADMNVENLLGQNAFDVALFHKNLTVLELLIDNINNNISQRTFFKLLVDLINENLEDFVEKLLKTCISFNINIQEDNINFLLLAVEKKQLKTVKCLLERGADVNYFDKLCDRINTVIYKACEIGDLEIVKVLLDYGARTDIANTYSDTCRIEICYFPIHIATEENHLDVVEELIKRGDKIDMYNSLGKFLASKTPLHIACECGHLELVKFLIENGANLSLKSTVNDGEYSESVIILALDWSSPANLSRYETFRYILSLDNFKLTESEGKEIAFQCAFWDYPIRLGYLFDYYTKLHPENELRYQLDVNVFNNQNLKRPLIHTASRNESINCIEMLVANGIDINLQNPKGRTALHVAFRYRQFLSIISLIENGADINILCHQGLLPVHHTINDQLREHFLSSDEDEDNYDCGHRESDFGTIKNYYGYHIIKLKCLELFVNDDNYCFALNNLKKPFKNSEKYKEEIVKMKEQTISCGNSSVTYYNFVRTTLNGRIDILTNNPNVLEVLEKRENYSTEFPEFVAIISNLFHSAFARKKLLDKFYNCEDYNVLVNNLSSLMVQKIISYLSNSDLRSIIHQFTFFKKNNLL